MDRIVRRPWGEDREQTKKIPAHPSKACLPQTLFSCLMTTSFQMRTPSGIFLVTYRIQKQCSSPPVVQGGAGGGFQTAGQRHRLYDPPLAPPLPGWGICSTIHRGYIQKGCTSMLPHASPLLPPVSSPVSFILYPLFSKFPATHLPSSLGDVPFVLPT